MSRSLRNSCSLQTCTNKETTNSMVINGPCSSGILQRIFELHVLFLHLWNKTNMIERPPLANLCFLSQTSLGSRSLPGLSPLFVHLLSCMECRGGFISFSDRIHAIQFSGSRRFIAWLKCVLLHLHQLQISKDWPARHWLTPPRV